MNNYRIVRRPISGVGHYFIQRKGWFFWTDINNTNNWANNEGFPFETQWGAEANLMSVLTEIEDSHTKDVVVYQTKEQE